MIHLAIDLLEGFLDALGQNGVPVLAPRRVDFLRAVTLAPLRSIDDLYWVARVTVVSGVGQIEAFDRVFDAWFRSGVLPDFDPVEQADDDDESETERPGGGSCKESSPVELGEGTGRQASGDELMSRRRLSAATLNERRVWAETVEVAQNCIPRTGGRRRVRDRRTGALDVRRVLGEAMRTGGDVVHLHYRRRPRRMRRVLLLIDVSGSLKANSPDFIRFAHAVVHGGERVEIFTFGTRLTRVTPALRQPDVDQALASLAEVIHDFDGGTRIGGAFARLLGNSRFLPFARGAVILVLSDGLERGDPGQMAETTERLARLGHRLIWLSPMLGDPAYRPATRGMQAILGSLDHLGDASAHAALLAELKHLPELMQRPRRRAAMAWQERRRSA
jgi:uncharacterized protein